VLEARTAGRNARTLTAYSGDLAAFAAWSGAPDAPSTLRALLAHGHGEANGAALLYRAAMTDAGLAPATINRRLAALRSVVKLARQLGVIAWALDVSGVKAERRRDVRGPDVAGFRRLLDVLAGRDNEKARRDRAILRLLYDVALRRSELVGLDLADVDLEAAELRVIRKGKRERQALTLPPETVAALRDWIAARGAEPGPLFRNADRAGKGSGRLTAGGVHGIVGALGRAAGLTVRPHGLRHAAITAALDATGGDVRRVQRFAGHASPTTTMQYDDARADLAGSVARLVAAGAGS
jgi:integrase/recombinase XerC